MISAVDVVEGSGIPGGLRVDQMENVAGSSLLSNDLPLGGHHYFNSLNNLASRSGVVGRTGLFDFSVLINVSVANLDQPSLISSREVSSTVDVQDSSAGLVPDEGRVVLQSQIASEADRASNGQRDVDNSVV